MIDFSELPADGTAFEQLLREMFLKYGMSVHWTGKGPDHGRDLIVVESLVGQLADAERKWLVQCKHNAHSGKAVGRGDIGSVIDDCAQADAEGYLLACSTVASAGVVTKLSEISQSPERQLVTLVWDHAEIERRLDSPHLFGLAQMFFPRSTATSEWRLYNAGLPNKWTANYKGCFVILICRVGGAPPPLSSCGIVIDSLLATQREKPGVNWWEQEEVRPRLLFWDDKHSDFSVYADYILPQGSEPPLITPTDFATQLHDGCAREVNGEYVPPCHYHVTVRRAAKTSDRFHRNDPAYYRPYEGGVPHDVTSLETLAEHGNHWR